MVKAVKKTDNLKEKKRQESKSAIIKAAKAVFLQGGYAGASMSQIAKKARVAQGLIYYYFENKEEINQAIENERDYWDKLNDYINEISAHCQNLIQDIFIKKKNIDEIQEKYKYSSKHNAQNQKHKCVEQIRKIKKEDNF